METPVFPNGFVSYRTTLSQLGMLAGWATTSHEEAKLGNKLLQLQKEHGFAVWDDTLHEWAMEYEQKNLGREWDGEYYDDINDFFATKNAISQPK